MNRREVQAEARKRNIKVTHEVKKKSMRDANRAAREVAKGEPLRSKRKDGSIPEHERKAERNAKVAKHRARNAGKTEEEAEAAARAAYLRAIAKHTPDEAEKEELLAAAKEETKSIPGNRTRPKSEDKPLCGARRSTKADDGSILYCELLAGWGTPHSGFGRCKYHGGMAPNGIIAAEKEKVMTEVIEREIQFYGEAQEIDPIEALSQEVRRTAGHVAWLGEQIRNFDGDAEGLTESSSQGRQKNIIIGMYQDERDRLVRVSKIAIDAGLAERSVQLAEAQGQMLAMVIRDILWDKELQLTPHQRQLSQDVVRRHLLALDTASEELPVAVEAPL